MHPKALIAWLLSLLAFIYVLFDFSSIWPLAAVDVGKPRGFYVERAREIFDQQGIDHQGYQPFVSLAVRTEVLDTVQAEQSIDTAADLAAKPNGMVRFYVRFKKTGTPRVLIVTLHPNGDLIGVSQANDPDLAKGGFSEAEFRKLAGEIIQENFHIDINELKESKFDAEVRDGVNHYRVDYERFFEGSASIKEIFAVATGSKELVALGRRVELTEKAKLERKRQKGGEQVLNQFGYLAMFIGILLSYILFLYQLRKGEIKLGPALKVSIVMFIMVVISGLLDANSRYRNWDPVWPIADMWLKLFRQEFIMGLWALILGWTLLAGGTQAPAGGRERMRTFWDYTRFKWNRKEIALASLRGGAIGFSCGAATILLVRFFELTMGGEVGLQPRAFYLSILDRQWPAIAIVLFFFPIAVVEEAGYRLFAASWIRHLMKSKLWAIILPAIVFGIIHTSLGFLPPEKPWWGRAVLMIMIGLIWGWAFFKFDFLTVVLCHFMADVVIFSWPLLVSEYVPSKIMAGIGISAALWPAITWGVLRLVNPSKTE